MIKSLLSNRLPWASNIYGTLLLKSSPACSCAVKMKNTITVVADGWVLPNDVSVTLQ
jgi:hypothetical protein